MIVFVFTGSDKPENLCAVVGCKTAGRPQVCPYDGERHGHGRIHYTCHSYPHNRPDSTLVFRPESWYQMCDEHYAQVLRELAESFKRERAAR